MDEDNSDWLSGAAEEPPAPEPAPVAAAAATAAPGAPGAPAPEGPEAPNPVKLLVRSIIGPEDAVKDTLQLLQVEAQRAAKQALVNKHWARPRFLQYDYLYHYMHNYYDDVIDYLDRRMRGYEVETLKPQTWAERALRTYTRNTYPNSVTYKLFETRPPKSDAALLHTPHWANTWHSEHTKDFYNRKYKAILF